MSRTAIAVDAAVCHLKPDLESQGERTLAALEINALLGRAPFGSEVPNGDFISIGSLTPEQVSLLQARLAFTDQIVCGSEVITCAQAVLERASSDLASLKHNAISSHTRRRNEYLSHGFHKYKAKFFPRMARALINIVCGSAGARLLDPFVGSGTSIIEAYTMRVESTGVDLDPLSIFISEQKLAALRLLTEDRALPERLASVASGTPSSPEQELLFRRVRPKNAYRLPSYIRTKLPESAANVLELDVAMVRNYVENLENDGVRLLARLALSHAVATKMNLRWMGTGDNRFSLSVRSASVSALFARQLRFMAKELSNSASLLHVNGTRAELFAGSALALPFDRATFDGIVTSPPYIPASSGRETYLRSRGPSLLALELMSEAELLRHEAGMMGSVLNNDEPTAPLPEQINSLVDWMRPQRARSPKAVATARYFTELRTALFEMARVLKPGGTVAMVLSSAHVFYDLMTKETVRVLDMPSTIETLVIEAGNIPLRLRRTVRIELAKMDYAARPAARGGYSESVLFFERVS